MTRLSILISVLLSTACGTEGATAAEQCDDFVSAICTRAIECGGPGSHAQCVQAFQQGFGCGGAKGVSASYARCLQQIEAATCPTLFSADGDLSLPADCTGVILF